MKRKDFAAFLAFSLDTEVILAKDDSSTFKKIASIMSAILVTIFVTVVTMGVGGYYAATNIFVQISIVAGGISLGLSISIGIIAAAGMSSLAKMVGYAAQITGVTAMVTGIIGNIQAMQVEMTTAEQAVVYKEAAGSITWKAAGEQAANSVSFFDAAVNMVKESVNAQVDKVVGMFSTSPSELLTLDNAKTFMDVTTKVMDKVNTHENESFQKEMSKRERELNTLNNEESLAKSTKDVSIVRDYEANEQNIFGIELAEKIMYDNGPEIQHDRRNAMQYGL